MTSSPISSRPTSSSAGRPPSCFKCGGRLRPYHRSGVLVEQCEDCRGIFLDGGELERLIDAEGGGWSGRIGAPWPAVAGSCDGEPVASGRKRRTTGPRRSAAVSAVSSPRPPMLGPSRRQ